MKQKEIKILKEFSKMREKCFAEYSKQMGKIWTLEQEFLKKLIKKPKPLNTY